jgi:two-component system LytT family sensor kinase
MTDSALTRDVEWLRPWRVAVAAVVVGAVEAIESYAMLRMRSATASFANQATLYFTFWVVWGFFAPLVMQASAAIARARVPLFARLALHLAIGTTLGVANAAIVFTARLLFGLIGPPTMRAYAGFIGWQLTAELLAYGLIAAAYHLSESQAVTRHRERSEAQMQSELTAARLATLREQLHPHFLFNTLNSISALADDNPREARRAVALLSDLLRRSLDAPDDDWTILRDELRFAEVYLTLERMRYGDRLRVETHVDDSMPDDISIPTFVLVPLLENAIKHGVARHRGPALVRLEAMRDGKDIRLGVANTGEWIQSVGSAGSGLARLRRRLAELYHGAATVEMQMQEGLVYVAVRMPFVSPAAAVRRA